MRFGRIAAHAGHHMWLALAGKKLIQINQCISNDYHWDGTLVSIQYLVQRVHTHWRKLHN